MYDIFNIYKLNWKMEEDVKKAYLTYFENYAQRNWHTMLKSFSDSITVIGTGIDEFATNSEKSKELFSREFKQAHDPIKYSIKDINVFPLSNSIAYIIGLFDIDFNLPNGEFSFKNNRTTAILRKENDEWRIVHGHWSQPCENQKVGESIPLNVIKHYNTLKDEVVKSQKELEEQNNRLKSMNETKNKLFSIVSHDLKSPFNAFMGITDLMLINFEEEFTDKEYFRVRLQLLNEMSHSLYDLTENLLNWSRLNVSEIKPKIRLIPIDAIIQKQVNALQPLWMKKNIRIKENVPNELMFETDPDIVAIVVRNLLSNAIKFSEPNSTVEITSLLNDGLLELYIKDYGIGMSEEQLANLFDSYSSTRGTDSEKGSGIGLITCKEMISKLKGEIIVKSKLNEGSEFKVIIPA